MSHRRSRCARGLVEWMEARSLDSNVMIVDDELRRGFVACREWSRAKKA